MFSSSYQHKISWWFILLKLVALRIPDITTRCYILEFIIVILDSGSICILPAWEMSAEGPSWGFMVPFDTSLLMCMGKGVGGEDAQLDALFCNMANDLTLWYLLIPVYFRLLINPTYFLSGFFFFNLCQTSSQTQDLLQCSASTLPLSVAQLSSSGQHGPAAHCEHATTANESILHSHKKPLKYWVKTVLPCQTPAQCHLLFFQQVAEDLIQKSELSYFKFGSLRNFSLFLGYWWFQHIECHSLLLLWSSLSCDLCWFLILFWGRLAFEIGSLYSLGWLEAPFLLLLFGSVQFC